MDAYCKKQGLVAGSVRFSFDGNRLTGSETAEQVRKQTHLITVITSPFRSLILMIRMWLTQWLNKLVAPNSFTSEHTKQSAKEVQIIVNEKALYCKHNVLLARMWSFVRLQVSWQRP